ncbi:hypothetical protein GSI_11184 [Ganoderma sinense ZZ0214-1]|uniref:Uncharacterized protein n=1 Tax=Ganoderma sinense ZZ0214-1 TaxID=1077348 RepID=A0A2G8RZN5_9APHY|nr:hypothetical protein GSI_11184 [Ganoderma sinense ZZ0214-1]
MAVNRIIQKKAAKAPDPTSIKIQCFAVADTHRKVYPNFGITPLDSPHFKDFIHGFNALLCLDMGQVVKAGSKKGYGDSDSTPEP